MTRRAPRAVPSLAFALVALAAALLTSGIATGGSASAPRRELTPSFSRQAQGQEFAPSLGKNPPDPTPVRTGRLSTKDRAQVFDKVWKEINERFYDPKFRGVNWNEVRQRYEPLVASARSDEEFYELIKRMTGELHDAHTRFSTPAEWQIQKKHEGVSPGFTAEEIDGKMVVSEVRPDSDPARAGIEPGMIILTLDGRPIAERMAEAKSKLLPSSSDRADRLHLYRAVFGGPPNGTAKLGLQRADGSKFETYVTRKIYPNPPSVEARSLPSGDGYIRFDAFERTVTKQFKAALERFRNAPGLIVDLRRNGGGNLGALLPMAGYFFNHKTLFARNATRTGKPLSQFGGLFKLGLNLYSGRAGDQIYARPVVILVRARTASAAEIFAAGMQETHRAEVIGSQTCGCVVGIVKPREMKGGGVLEVGEMLWLTPKGRKLEGEGVIPDKTVVPRISELRQRRDPLLEEAEKTLREAAAKSPAEQR